MTKTAAYLLMVLLIIPFLSNAKKVIELKPSQEDMTLVIRKALEARDDSHIKLVFEKGTYKFHPDFAFSEYRYVTNHENGLKKIAFPFKGYKSVEIEGNGAELIFHGQMFPFLFEGCEKVSVSGLTIDWDIPFLFQGEVIAVNEDEGWRELKPFTDGFSWKLEKGQITFPNIDNFTFSALGSSLPFEKDPKRVAHGAWDTSSKPHYAEKLDNGNLRFHEKLKHYPTVGTILNSKGPKGENRYAPAFQAISSKNISFENITIHHALGMGFLAERSENISIKNSGIYVREGSPRVVSIIADATHFCNCKGDVLVENCRFEQMLDDGTNVHGTYVEVNEIVDAKTLRCEIKHFQQMGFEFAGAGDEIWFVHQPSPQRAGINKVVSINVINERFAELTFKNKLPENLKEGDILENKTWNPTFTMRGCTIQNHRARNIVLKTPLKILIEDNYFSSMMSAILFRGETSYWFESGNVEDVLIQNNTFNYCAYSGNEHAVMYITPRLGKAFDVTEEFDRGIKFINNNIATFDSRIVIADRAEGLIIKGNKITKTNSAKALYPDAPLFELINCKNVQIENNTYTGDFKTAIIADEKSKSTLKVKGNKGF